MGAGATSVAQSPFPDTMTPNGIIFTGRNTSSSVNMPSPASGLVIPDCQRAVSTSPAGNQMWSAEAEKTVVQYLKLTY